MNSEWTSLFKVDTELTTSKIKAVLLVTWLVTAETSVLTSAGMTDSTPPTMCPGRDSTPVVTPLTGVKITGEARTWEPKVRDKAAIVRNCIVGIGEGWLENDGFLE